MNQPQQTQDQPFEQAPQAASYDVQSRTLKMTFSRKTQPVQYEDCFVSATMEVQLPPGTTIAQARNVFNEEYAVLKSEVLRQQGLGFTMDPTEKLIMETFPGAQMVQMEAQAPPQMQVVPNQPSAPAQMPPPQQASAPLAQAVDQGNPFNPPPAMQGQPQQTPGSNPTYEHWQSIVNDLQNSPGYAEDGNKKMSSWYDNRIGKRNPNAPDFKSKQIQQPDNPQYKLGLWLRDCPADLKGFLA